MPLAGLRGTHPEHLARSNSFTEENRVASRRLEGRFRFIRTTNVPDPIWWCSTLGDGTVPLRKPLPRPDGFLRVVVWESRVEPPNKSSEETVESLCKQVVAEQDLKKLLDLTTKIRRLIDARSKKKPLAE